LLQPLSRTGGELCVLLFLLLLLLLLLNPILLLKMQLN